jgi:hypothetical protein
MKKLLLLIPAIMLMAQTNYAVSPVLSDDQQITAIDIIKSDIDNHLSSMTQTEVYNNASGSRYDYRDGGILRKVVMMTHDGNVDKTQSWYFNNGQFVACQEVWTNTTDNTTITSERYYFGNSELFAWFRNDRRITNDSGQFTIVAEQLPGVGTGLMGH